MESVNIKHCMTLLITVCLHLCQGDIGQAGNIGEQGLIGQRVCLLVLNYPHLT